MSATLADVHLCGSVPFADAESVFRMAADRLGDHLGRIPDGETGERANWVGWQLSKLQAHPDLETVTPPGREYGPRLRVQPKAGVDPSSVSFGPLGYAAAAIDSWRLFSRLRDEGVIAPGIRFQVSLPTPIAVVGAFVGAHQAELEHAYEARLLAELDEMIAAIPAGQLAIQWDIAVEFQILEGVSPSWFGNNYSVQEAGVVERLVRLGNAVPAEAELGYHMCYGDYGHRHFVEPSDTSKLASVTAKLAAGLERRLDWVHLPVPRNRTDTDYFAPLSTLGLGPETTLYLGLVHATDGVEGGLRRIAAAREVVNAFGVAAECGLGRRAAEQIPDLLNLHVTLAKASPGIMSRR